MTTAQHGGASAEALITTNTKISAIEYLRELLPSRSPSPLPSPLSPVSADTTAAADSEVAKEVKGRSPARSPFEDQPKIKYMMAQPSGVTQEGLIRSLKEKVGATHVEIEDMSGGCGQAFSALIVSPQFEKKTTLARHRMVNTALKEEVAAIHAWTPKCYTPEQWEKLSVKGNAPEPAQGKVEGTTA